MRRIAVATTLRFVDAFPDHEHAASVLRAAVDDLYTMESYAEAITTGERLISSYPEAGAEVLRPTWLAVAHSAFATEDYVALRAGLRPGARADGGRRRHPCCRGGQPRGLDLPAGRARQRGGAAPGGGGSLPAHRRGGARLGDPRDGRVRCRRGPDPGRGLGCRHRGARRLPREPSRPRAPREGDAAARQRVRAAGRSRGLREGVRANRDRQRGPGGPQGGPARGGRPLRARRCIDARAIAVYEAYVERHPEPAGERHRDALQAGGPLRGPGRRGLRRGPAARDRRGRPSGQVPSAPIGSATWPRAPP